MRKITKLILEDVRCFRNEALDIRPLTLLVGENSTGKSTALGCLHIFGDFINGKREGIDFNSDPYQMGAFADIVRKTKPKNDCFKLGIECYNEHGEPFTCKLFFRERETGSEPIIEKVQYYFDDGEITVIKENNNTDFRYLKTTEQSRNKFVVTCNLDLFQIHTDIPFLDYILVFLHRKETNREIEKEEIRFLFFLREKLMKKRRMLSTPFHRIRSFAPIRSKPERTYNPLKGTADPWGSETPMLIRNLKNRDKDQWEKLHKQLVEFGKASGLFSDIIVRELGRAMNDPFQLQIKVKAKSPIVNLVDVGYGVSQILPILVNVFTAHTPIMFLLQQPEEHLHPSVQSELSSLLVSMHENFGHSFLLETHSDYMIDRVRILVRQKKIKPEDVSIVYFEPMKMGSTVKIHNMKVDEMGNLTNVPQNYRKFFTKETNILLGFDEE